ncbi:hypothetical protein TrVFT333_009624 [Trichoderma virens FT-333]|nr:hypothetical protein TrVFT333_009624 [Trichoderma virens FT-333]
MEFDVGGYWSPHHQYPQSWRPTKRQQLKNPYPSVSPNGAHPPSPSLLATLITALHARPLQPLPLTLFTPTLLFSSYLNLSGYPTASAGLTAAWSGLYALLALRRRQTLRAKFSIRGIVRGTAVGLGAANCVAGGWVYLHGSKDRDRDERESRNRWGQFDDKK